MSNINQLSTINTLQGGDLIPVWSTNNGDTRKASMTTLATYMQSALTLPGALATQYSAPSASGFSVTVSAGDTWLVLTPTGTLAVWRNCFAHRCGRQVCSQRELHTNCNHIERYIWQHSHRRTNNTSCCS
jgi:hypothetical protein